MARNPRIFDSQKDEDENERGGRKGGGAG